VRTANGGARNANVDLRKIRTSLDTCPVNMAPKR